MELNAALAVLGGMKAGGDAWRIWLPGAPRVTAHLPGGAVLDCLVALRFGQRLRGLIGCPIGRLCSRAVLFPRCASLHTMSMGFALDVAFVGEAGEVLCAERLVAPGRIIGVQGAALALEREASAAPWPVKGERLIFTGAVSA